MVYPERMADTSHELSTSVLRERLEAAFPSLLDELTQLVAIPSVSSDPAHAAEIASAVRRLNASTYLPKVTSAITDTGAIALHLQHTFNWVVGATDAQVNAEVSQFIMASISMMNQLNVMFPDQWTKEAANA